MSHWRFYQILLSSMLLDLVGDRAVVNLSPKQQRLLAHKRALIRRVWFASMGVVMLHPALYMLLAVGLFATFLSFAIIDELPWK
ncbi:hypothetical protein ACFSJ3_04470 [Corallincola platygyrae]|uniref:Uncharacterized protein n=1 Tax=Corallincola platygyrae TaxID=1193278 RepID=A0ABW4XJI4_9GAMM